MTRAELLHESRAVFERQCRAHGLDPTDVMLRGVFNNLLQYILDEWALREREINSKKEG